MPNGETRRQVVVAGAYRPAMALFPYGCVSVGAVVELHRPVDTSRARAFAEDSVRLWPHTESEVFTAYTGGLWRLNDAVTIIRDELNRHSDPSLVLADIVLRSYADACPRDDVVLFLPITPEGVAHA